MNHTHSSSAVEQPIRRRSQCDHDDKHITKPPAPTKINLRESSIKVISGIGGCPTQAANIVSLDLSRNLICKIQNLERFTCLSHLNLSYNRIDFLENLENLALLTHLDVSHNRIKILPKSLALNSRLRVLDISHNQIQKHDALTVLDKIPSLQSLNVSHNPLLVRGDNKENANSRQPNENLFDSALLKSTSVLRSSQILRVINQPREQLSQQLLFDSFKSDGTINDATDDDEDLEPSNTAQLDSLSYYRVIVEKMTRVFSKILEGIKRYSDQVHSHGSSQNESPCSQNKLVLLQEKIRSFSSISHGQVLEKAAVIDRMERLICGEVVAPVEILEKAVKLIEATLGQSDQDEQSMDQNCEVDSALNQILNESMKQKTPTHSLQPSWQLLNAHLLVWMASLRDDWIELRVLVEECRNKSLDILSEQYKSLQRILIEKKVEEDRRMQEMLFSSNRDSLPGVMNRCFNCEQLEAQIRQQEVILRNYFEDFQTRMSVLAEGISGIKTVAMDSSRRLCDMVTSSANADSSMSMWAVVMKQQAKSIEGLISTVEQKDRLIEQLTSALGEKLSIIVKPKSVDKAIIESEVKAFGSPKTNSTVRGWLTSSEKQLSSAEQSITSTAGKKAVSTTALMLVSQKKQLSAFDGGEDQRKITENDEECEESPCNQGISKQKCQNGSKVINMQAYQVKRSLLTKESRDRMNARNNGNDQKKHQNNNNNENNKQTVVSERHSNIINGNHAGMQCSCVSQEGLGILGMGQKCQSGLKCCKKAFYQQVVERNRRQHQMAGVAPSVTVGQANGSKRSSISPVNSSREFVQKSPFKTGLKNSYQASSNSRSRERLQHSQSFTSMNHRGGDSIQSDIASTYQLSQYLMSSTTSEKQLKDVGAHRNQKMSMKEYNWM